MRKVVLLGAGVLLALTSFCQAPKKSLKECVDIALANNLRIQRSIYNVASFDANLLQAKGAFLPTLNGSGSYVNNYGRAQNPTTSVWVDKNSTAISPSLTSSLLLFNGLRLQYQYKQSVKDVAAADYDLQKAKNDVILNVVTLYTNVIFNRELLDNAKYQLNSSQQVLDRIKKQVDAGALSLSNQLNQDAQVATNELNMINQENTLNLSILQLKQAMQIPASEQLDVEVPDLPLEETILEKTAEEIYNIALESMPEMKSAVIKVESAELALKSSKGSYYPRLNLNASASSNSSSLNAKNSTVVDYGNYALLTAHPSGQTAGGQDVYAYQYGTVTTSENYPHLQQLQDNVFKSLSLSINIPILNGFNTRTNVQRAVITKSLADITILETRNTLRQSIETAFNDASAAARSYSSSLRQVNSQQEAYRMNKQRFEVGALNIIEYQVSENDLYRAKSDLTRAKYNFIFKKKVLDFYQGNPIDY